MKLLLQKFTILPNLVRIIFSIENQLFETVFSLWEFSVRLFSCIMYWNKIVIAIFGCGIFFYYLFILLREYIFNKFKKLTLR